jgi:hypothetical protein
MKIQELFVIVPGSMTLLNAQTPPPPTISVAGFARVTSSGQNSRGRPINHNKRPNDSDERDAA